MKVSGKALAAGSVLLRWNLGRRTRGKRLAAYNETSFNSPTGPCCTLCNLTFGRDKFRCFILNPFQVDLSGSKNWQLLDAEKTIA